MNPRRVRVFKVGGSLFDMPDLAHRLRSCLAAQSPAPAVFVAGGGPMADYIRTATPLHRLSDAQAHWICIDLLTASARLLAAILGESQFISSYPELERLLQEEQNALTVFAPADFLHAAEATLPGTPLPQDWSATSDSIAARLAGALGAQELVLLKSIDLAFDLTLKSAAERGFVDRFFPQAAMSLPGIRWVNLRCSPVREVYLRR